MLNLNLWNSQCRAVVTFQRICESRIVLHIDVHYPCLSIDSSAQIQQKGLVHPSNDVLHRDITIATERAHERLQLPGRLATSGCFGQLVACEFLVIRLIRWLSITCITKVDGIPPMNDSQYATCQQFSFVLAFAAVTVLVGSGIG